MLSANGTTEAQRSWLTFHYVLILAILLIGSISMSNNSSPAAAVSAPAPVPSASAVTTTTTPTTPTIITPRATATLPQPGTTVDWKYGKAYMRSPERVEAYRNAWPAAEKVARAIIDGKFGPFKAYTENKVDLPKDHSYMGWGGMQTADRSAYAWVWWNCDGSVDYSKGVKGFSLYGLQFETSAGDEPYKVFIPRGSYTDVVDATYIGGISPLEPYRSPVTIAQIGDLDTEALELLNANLAIAGLL